MSNMWLLAIGFGLALPLCAAASEPGYVNITITAPNGTSIHGDPHLLCTPTRWYHIAVFFLSNFAAHAATVRTFPGENSLATTMVVVLALLCPTFGVVRGLQGILQHAVTSDTPLKTAQRAGALWKVVRTNQWRPRDGDEVEIRGIETTDELLEQVRRKYGRLHVISKAEMDGLRRDILMAPRHSNPGILGVDGDRGDAVGQAMELEEHEPPASAEVASQSRRQLARLRVFVRSSGNKNGVDYVPRTRMEFLDTKTRNIHGQCRLPEGYALARVPDDASVEPFGEPVPSPDIPPASSLKRTIQVGWQFYTTSLLLFCLPPANLGQRLQDLENPAIQRRQEVEASGRGKYDAYRHTWGFGVAIKLAKLQQHLEDTRRAAMESISLTDYSHSGISSSYSFTKALVAVFQVISAAVTLYRSKGDQIDRFGYAAFGLTVTPYLVMSFVNGFSVLLTPSYPTIFLVQTEAMEEASRRDGSFFSGQVGIIKSQRIGADSRILSFSATSSGEMRATIRRAPFEHDHNAAILKTPEAIENTLTAEEYAVYSGPDATDLPVVEVAAADGKEMQVQTSLIVANLMGYLVGIFPLAIIGGLSKFRDGSSTKGQRVWTMMWLATSVFSGPTVALMDQSTGLVIGLFYVGAAAIGGYVTIAQMMMEYGYCVRLY